MLFVWTGRWWTQPLLRSQRELSRTFTCCSSCKCPDQQQRTFTTLKHPKLIFSIYHQLDSHLPVTKYSQNSFLHSRYCIRTQTAFVLQWQWKWLQLLEMNGYWKQWWHSSNKSKVALYQCRWQSLTPFSSARQRAVYPLRCNHECVVTSVCVWIPNTYLHLILFILLCIA